jgi:hypothetical protein
VAGMVITGIAKAKKINIPPEQVGYKTKNLFVDGRGFFI